MHSWKPSQLTLTCVDGAYVGLSAADSAADDRLFHSAPIQKFLSDTLSESTRAMLMSHLGVRSILCCCSSHQSSTHCQLH